MKKRKAILCGAVVVLLAGTAAWALGVFNRTDPAVAELQQIGSQMWDRTLPEAQHNQIRDDFRQRMESLTDDQRRAFFDANRDQWTGQMQKRMDEFFAMSKADQQKRLDEIINRMVQARNSPQLNANSRNQQNATGVNQQNPRSRDANGNRGDRRNMSEAQRDERAKKRLDRTTPKMRAQFSEFRKQLEARAQQRGISLGDQRGGFSGGFGRGPRGA